MMSSKDRITANIGHTVIPCVSFRNTRLENTMSHNKAIKHGKEHRRPYRGSRRFDHSCRNHGGCGYCRGNRLYAASRRTVSADERLIE